METENPLKISVVIPVYGCKTALTELYIRLKNTLEKLADSFEIILVNDASPDGAWDTIVELAGNDTRVKGINFSRNFGQHYAITAGLDYCSGEWVVVMDCDLQDQPEEIEKLYHKALEGFDIVMARRAIRRDTLYKRMSSKIFYRLFSYLTDTSQDSSVANFGVYRKIVIESIKTMGDYYRVFPILVQWVGFDRCYINVDHSARFAGKSSYSAIKLYRLAFDMIISFSEKPMRLGMKFGIFVSLLSILLSVNYLILFLLGKILVPGFASLVILITLSTGLIITFLGLVGSYVGKISLQVKERPKYIIKGKINS
jgi:dolichol-phosphate mannosyltransferase